VDGIYSADPKRDPQARKIDRITYADAIKQGLKVVDAAAFSLCMENGLPMVVFGLEGEGQVTRALMGERMGTLVTA
jgi:uridylate kinase